MRANYFHYKIAASIAVLALAVPMSLYMWRQEGPAVPLLVRDVSPAAIDPATARKAKQPALESNSAATRPATAEPAKPAQPSIWKPSYYTPQKKSQESAGTADDRRPYQFNPAPTPAPAAGGANQPTVVRSEAYKPDGTRIDSRPVITPNIANVDNGLPYPFGGGTVPKPAPAKPALAASPAAQPGQPQFTVSATAAPKPDGRVTTVFEKAPASGSGAGLKQYFDETQVFRFGAATRFDNETPRGGATPHARLAQEGAQPYADTNYSLSAPGVSPEPTPSEAEQSRAQFEAFASNAVKQVAVEPVSTFSIDVDTAAYGFVRRSLLAGRMPPKDAVRVEEMINYFPYAYPRPESAAVPFQPTVTVTPAPWKPTNKLVHIGIKGYEIAAKERPRANLVLLLDVSGSMAPEDRLPLLKNAFRMLLGELKPDDTVGIVTYASQSGVALEPTRVAERGKIADVLDRLNAGGSTAGGEGLQNAYRLAEKHLDKNAVNRIILATDGDFNVGISDHEQLKRFIEAKRQSGIFLSVIGVGQDNYNDRLMQALAQNGNGVAAYVDTLNEARKVLVDEASSSLFPIAKDVKIQIEFNPAQVSEYRLIGYETRALRREDFNNDKVDAGDIGSGHTVTAIYEVTPVGAPKFVDDLRYQKPQVQPAPASGSGIELAFLKIRYKMPGEETSKLITAEILPRPAAGHPGSAGMMSASRLPWPRSARCCAASRLQARYSFDDIIALAQTARGPDSFGYRAEFLNLVRLAKSARQ